MPTPLRTTCAQVLVNKQHDIIVQYSAGGVGLVVEGSALAVGLLPDQQVPFLDLCKLAQAVVCCRVSPIQKAQVRLLKRSLRGF